MPNLTIAIDEETYRAARMKAAVQGLSISAMVKRYLIELTAQDARFASLAQEEEAIRARIEGFDASDRLARNELYRDGA